MGNFRARLRARVNAASRQTNADHLLVVDTQLAYSARRREFAARVSCLWSIAVRITSCASLSARRKISSRMECLSRSSSRRLPLSPKASPQSCPRCNRGSRARRKPPTRHGRLGPCECGNTPSRMLVCVPTFSGTAPKLARPLRGRVEDAPAQALVFASRAIVTETGCERRSNCTSADVFYCETYRIRVQGILSGLPCQRGLTGRGSTCFVTRTSS